MRNADTIFEYRLPLALRQAVLTIAPAFGLRPSYLIIGAMRSGTSALLKHIACSPEIIAHFGQEIHYFDRHFQHGVAWYHAHFAWFGRGPARITGEKSVNYLFNPHAAARVRAYNEKIRLIVVLRNPVDRALSHYRKSHFRDGRDPAATFEEALDLEASRAGPDLARMATDERHYPSAVRWFSYQAKGHYAEQLERWFEHFPREQFLILRAEDYFARPQESLDQIADHIGIKRFELCEAPQKASGNQDPMSAATRQRLIEYYRPHNERLAQLLGHDFDWDR